MLKTQDLQATARLATVSVERLLTTPETARLLNVSPSWLAKARVTGDGPRFVKIGRGVRYGESAVRDYIRARTRGSTSEV